MIPYTMNNLKLIGNVLFQRFEKTLLMLFHFPLWDERCDAAREMERGTISFLSSPLILLKGSTLARSQQTKPPTRKSYDSRTQSAQMFGKRLFSLGTSLSQREKSM